MSKGWMRALLAVATAVILVGCSQNGGSSEKPNEAMDPPVDQVPGSTNTGGGDSDPVGSTQGGVGTVTAGATAGGMTPMTGTDSVGGGGYGVGSAAKDQAREAASQAGAGSMGQADSDQ